MYRGAGMNTESFYCGVLDYSGLNPYDGQDVWHMIQEIRMMSREDAKNVRHVNLSNTCLDLMRPSDHSSLVSSVNEFDWLSVVRLDACRLRGDHMINLLHALLCLPFMQGRDPDVKDQPPENEPLYKAEISLQRNQIKDETVRLLSEKGSSFLRNSPAKGVHKLDLSYNEITDKTVRMMAHLTPKLTHLYLNGNSGFTGTHMQAHVTKFAPLSLLTMDKTGVNEEGIANLVAGLTKRKAADKGPVELWMRSMVNPPKEFWCPLLVLCGAKVDAKSSFRVVIKHDLQNSMGRYHAGATSQHDCVLVKLFLHGWSPVEVKHFDVSSDMPISRVAMLAVNEITAVCLEDMKRPNNAESRGLRLRYCAALKHVIESGSMMMKVFKVETCRAIYTQRYSEEKKVVDGMSDNFIGAPKPGWDVVIEVAVIEDSDVLGRLSKAPRR